MRIILFFLIAVVVLVGLFFLFRPKNTSDPKDRMIELSIRNNSLEGNKIIRVPVRTKVTFRVLSDTNDELHLHGYDITIPLITNGRTTATFTADKTGGFPIELHRVEKEVALFEVTPN